MRVAFPPAVVLFVLSVAHMPVVAQQDGPWQLLDTVLRPTVAGAQAEPWIQPDVFQACSLTPAQLEQELAQIPQETTKAVNAGTIITLPMPDGTLARFEAYESPIMAPELAAKFPEIRTFIAQGIDDPAATVRFDWTPAGFHAQILSPNGTVYIDPYWKGDNTFYASYRKADYRKPNAFTCDVDRMLQEPPPRVDGQTFLTGSDGILHTYRAAVAATGEYTAFHGGTVAAGLAAVVTAMNRVSGVYEVDLAVRMNLVANNNAIIYTNSGTDPYTNSDGFAMLGQNQSNINSVIGSANYDIGHVFSTGGGGVASLGVVCSSSQKARGVTGHGSPVGDPFTIDYVAHEMGHQFGANHSFNSQTSSCGGGNRNASTAYEHGSGNTIMAYAGICGSDDLQPNSDAYFHSVSLDEIRQFVTSGLGANCDVPTATGNTPPTVDAGPNYSIPASTAFALTGIANDLDGDNLSYTWEQRDLGAATTLSSPDNGTSPIERPFKPSTSPTRFVPKLSSILANSVPASSGERYPTASRTMDWRLVVRDNRAGGGSFVVDNMIVTIITGTGPFQVTAPNTNITVNSSTNVTWNVANTTNPTVNAQFVDIYLSVDGGQTFPHLLASATPNDGNEVVGIPDIPSTTARIKVQGTGNIFFDISNTNFTIEACAAPSSPVAYTLDGEKSRFLSIDPQVSSVAIALQVVPISVPAGYESLLGQTLWVGPPQSFIDAPLVGNTFWASELQCTAHFGNWASMDSVHVYGAQIVPGAEYEVRSVRCDADDPDLASVPTVISTTVWGDVASPYEFENINPQPDIIDVASMVDRVKEASGAITKVHAAIGPADVDLTASITVIEIGIVVDALKGADYSYPAPSPCP